MNGPCYLEVLAGQRMIHVNGGFCIGQLRNANRETLRFDCELRVGMYI